jgi:hypothetical protein
MYARHKPNIPVHIAVDTDLAGGRFFNAYKDAVLVGHKRALELGELKGEAGKIIDARPDPEFKDWNNKIIGQRVENPYKPDEYVRGYPVTPLEKERESMAATALMAKRPRKPAKPELTKTPITDRDPGVGMKI